LAQQHARHFNTGAGSIFGPLSQTHFSKSEFKNGHISRFCFDFQVIHVISSGNFFSAEEVDLSFISWIWIHESDFKGFFLEKRQRKGFSIQCSNSGINESTPQTQSNVIWISSKAELEISFLNSLFWSLGKWSENWSCYRRKYIYTALSLKMRLEMLVWMQIEILDGGEILDNWSTSRHSNFSVSRGTNSNRDFGWIWSPLYLAVQIQIQILA